MAKPKLIEIPLSPFTRPTGTRNIRCSCCSRWEDDEQPDPKCKKCKGKGRYDHTYKPSQRESSEDDRIKPNATYLAKVDGEWVCGSFSKQWFGWILNGGVVNHQLDTIEELYEMVFPKKNKRCQKRAKRNRASHGAQKRTKS